MADRSGNHISKIISGVFGCLVTAVGYFLVSRDGEFKASVEKLWGRTSAVIENESRLNVELEKLRGENGQRTKILEWLADISKDQEQRIRSLEVRCRK